MTTKTSAVVYLTPSTEAEREALHEILAPHSWAAGEFGLMLTDAAFTECVRSLSTRTEKSVKAFLRNSLLAARKARAGDVCLNFGITG
jgi:hypothetical protein